MRECCYQCRGTGYDYLISEDSYDICPLCDGEGATFVPVDKRPEIVRLREDVMNAALKAGDYADAVYKYLHNDCESSNRAALERASKGLDKALMEIKTAQQEIHEYLYPQSVDGDESELRY